MKMLKPLNLIFVLLVLFSFFCVLSAEEDSPAAEGMNLEDLKNAEWIKKIKNPFERDRKEIEKLEKKRAKLPVGSKREKLDEKIIALEKALEEKKEKIAAKINRQLERLESQAEKQQDGAKKDEILMSIKEQRAALILLDCWAANEEPWEKLAELDRNMPNSAKEKKNLKDDEKTDSADADADSGDRDGKEKKNQKKKSSRKGKQSDADSTDADDDADADSGDKDGKDKKSQKKKSSKKGKREEFEE